MIKVDLTRTSITQCLLDEMEIKLKAAHEKLQTSPDNKWLHLPESVDAKQIDQIISKAEWVRKNCDMMLVIGVGGSYLGTFAGLRMLEHLTDFPIEFLGLSFDPTPVVAFLKKHSGKRICVNVISKSGTTLEISTAFDIIDKHLKDEHLIITTDATKGSMRELVKQKNLDSFVVPDGVGGRYSVLSAVVLFPFAVAGLDIRAMMSGAAVAAKNCVPEAEKYASARYLLHTLRGNAVEVHASFHQGMDGFMQWLQQLFGESEGKLGMGLFVSPMVFTRDLHSMGQYIQQGKPLLFETMVNFVQEPTDIGGMNRLNRAAFLGTVKAHSEAGVPVLVINVDKCDEQNFGYMVCFFEVACALSAYLLGVNPFDQPGVEFYKKNMLEFLKV